LWCMPKREDCKIIF